MAAAGGLKNLVFCEKYIDFAPLYKNARARARAEFFWRREHLYQLRMPLPSFSAVIATFRFH